MFFFTLISCACFFLLTTDIYFIFLEKSKQGLDNYRLLDIIWYVVDVVFNRIFIILHVILLILILYSNNLFNSITHRYLGLATIIID